MSILSELTIIIPSYNRQKFILRSAKFWSHKEVTVHFFDGSKTPIEKNELSAFGDNVFYHHAPIPYYDRLALGRDAIKTKYAALLSDDEFFSFQGLRECIDELENNSEIVACTGRSLGFYLADNEMMGFPAYPEMEGYQVMQDDPVDRLIYHMDHYTCSSIYAVVRAPVWKAAINSALDKHYPFYAVCELQFEAVVNFLGKTKVIQSLVWFRSFEQEPIRGNEPSLMTENSFNNWWNNPSKSIEHDEFVSRMTKNLAAAYPHSISNLNEKVYKAFSIYVKRTDIRNKLSFSYKCQEFFSKIIRSIVNIIPSSLKRFLRPYIIKPIQHTKSSTIARQLYVNGCKVSFDDFEKIREIFLKFYKNKL